MTGRRRKLALIAIPLLAVGCGLANELRDEPTQRVAAVPPPEWAEIRPPGTEAEVEAVPAPRPKPEPPPRKTVTAFATPRPEFLVGLGPEAALVLLGEPALRVQDPPGEIWQYNGRSCSLELTLLLDVVAEQYRTVFYEVRNGNSEVENGDRDCLAEIIADRRAKL
ncbi:MAG: hypothetical protein ACE5Q3_03590 [Alphaproteobacteria bacterium]